MDQTSPLPDLAESMQANAYAACCICLPVAIVALILRFVARHLSNAKLWYDDWFVLAAMASHLKSEYSESIY